MFLFFRKSDINDRQIPVFIFADTINLQIDLIQSSYFVDKQCYTLIINIFLSS